MPKKTVRDIPFADIARDWKLGSYFFGARFCPAVRRHHDDYLIRVVKSETRSGANINTTYDEFRCAPDGTVISAPRGHAKDYKPGRITGLDDAVAKYSAPDSSTLRIGF